MADVTFKDLIKTTAERLNIEESLVEEEIMQNYLPLLKTNLKNLTHYGFDFFFIGKLVPMVGIVSYWTEILKKKDLEKYEKFSNYLTYIRDTRKNKIWKKMI